MKRFSIEEVREEYNKEYKEYFRTYHLLYRGKEYNKSNSRFIYYCNQFPEKRISFAVSDVENDICMEVAIKRGINSLYKETNKAIYYK